MDNNKKKHIVSISLISSSLCNLNCSFCYLNKNKAYKDFNLKVQQAWNDGSYIKNAHRTVRALGNPADVEICQLWGGETLLQIENVEKNIEDLYKHFPNIEEWKISTNWIIDVNKFFSFVKTINEFANKKTHITLQLSIDGPEGEITESGHNGDWNTYHKNIKDFTNLVNNTHLKNVLISFQINATIEKELFLKTFSNYESMKNYVQYMKNFADEIDQCCISKSLEMSQILILPGYALPYTDDSEDGSKYLEICKLWDKVRTNEFPDIDDGFGFYYGSGQINREKHLFCANQECSELKSSLTINYDGSICECNGSFIDHYQPYLNELLENDQLHNYYTAKLRNYLTYNPGLASEEELEKKDWYIHSGYKNNHSTYLMCMFTVANELAESGQIDPIYKTDKDLLLRHLACAANLMSCTRENLNDTRVPYLLSASALRRYLNGVMTYAYNQKRDEFLKMKNKYVHNEDNSCKEGCE